MSAEILRTDFKLTFSQESDSCESRDDGQFLTIRTEDAGGGNFFIINTKRWAVSNIDEMIETLNQFKEKYDKLNK
jgi:hypothetical protein